jgi:acyl phosphate:glycerol-3-phosphate acyltransferase
VNITVAIVAAYLLGSIPFAYLAGKLRGVDIRTVGSKNVGATNVFRTLGKGTGFAVMGADIAKGLVAALVALALTGTPWTLFAGAAAILGHVFPVWLRFKGGKGVAVGGGVVLGLMPLIVLILAVIFVAIVAITRFVSLGSIAVAVAFTPLTLLFGEPWQNVVFAAAASVFVLAKHRANIGRLLRREELRLDFSRSRPKPGSG